MKSDQRTFFDRELSLGVVVDSGGNPDFKPGDAVFWCQSWDQHKPQQTDWAFVLNNMNKFQKYFHSANTIGKVEIATLSGRKFVSPYQLRSWTLNSYVQFIRCIIPSFYCQDALTLIAAFLIDEDVTSQIIQFSPDYDNKNETVTFHQCTASDFITFHVITRIFDRRPKAVILHFSKELIFDLSSLQMTHPQWPGNLTFSNESWSEKRNKIVSIIARLATIFQSKPYVRYRIKLFPDSDLPGFAQNVALFE